MAETTGCDTYDRLDKRLRQSYTNYKKLSKDGEIAGFYKYSCSTNPMYTRHHYYDDEMKPGDHTSDYLRGGVISTMATFEAFVGELINEATDLIADKYRGSLGVLDTINSCMSKKCRDDKPPELAPRNVLYHSWATYKCKSTCSCADCIKTNNGVYSKYLLTDLEIQQGKTIVDVMLGQGDLEFDHIIRCGTDPSKTSSIIVSESVGAPKQSKCFICIMLRFCYGIRCVMAHGNSDQTCKKNGGALYKFHECCQTCECNKDTCPTCRCFKRTARLVELYNKYIENFDEKKDEADIKDADCRVRRIPQRKDFEHFKTQHEDFLTPQEWHQCFEIIAEHFSDPEENPLPASYAYFHMLRVYYWLMESKRDMYITYGMFERITKFIHTLSFRMYLAVAQLLIENYPITGCKVWGVELSNIPTKITDFKGTL